MESPIPLIAVGSIVFLAHLFAVIFEKTRIPDVLPLVLLGLLLGPVTNFVHTESFGDVGHVFTTVALVIILFECGLDIDFQLLARSFLTSVKLGLINFSMTVATTVVLAHRLVGMTLAEGCILGSIVAACSPPVVVPMLAKLKVTEETRTTLILEATICEVLGIVSTLAFLKFAQHNTVMPTVVVGRIIASFVLAAILGGAAGLLWAKLLKFVRGVENNIFCTPAFVCILFGAAELFGYSGPVTALVFGLVLGNVSEVKSLSKLSRLPGEPLAVSFMERTFFSALVFLLKSLFFVYVGISMRFTSKELLGASFLLTVWTMIVRLLVTRFTVAKNFSSYDASIVSTMVPKGLAAAVLASMVMDSGLPAAGLIREMAFGVILFSITLVAISTFCIEKGWMTGFYNYIFSSSPESTGESAAPAAAENSPPQTSSLSETAPIEPLSEAAEAAFKAALAAREQSENTEKDKSAD
ncbi:MAG: cation:proton antiporter [Candidatus Obscuribacter sp.]|nr:cation:proton antiporter [Candidatus Melainabacteria bacterium]MDX1985255.1 cation:proton antiporter [Candidatus Obscuribacter sp.]